MNKKSKGEAQQFYESLVLQNEERIKRRKEDNHIEKTNDKLSQEKYSAMLEEQELKRIAERKRRLLKVEKAMDYQYDNKRAEDDYSYYHSTYK